MILYLSFGLGAAAMLALLVLVVVIGLPGNDLATGTAVPAADEALTTKPEKPLEHKPSSAPLALPAPPPVVATQQAAASATPAPTVAPAASSSVVVVASAQPAPTNTLLPLCTPTLQVGCRKPSGASAGAVAPNPFGSSKSTKGKYSPSGI